MSDDIRLTLPALVPYARVVRLAIAGLAARSGYSYDEVEDLRIAVGELFGVLVDPEAQVRFTCRLGPTSLDIEAQRMPPAAVGPLTDLTGQILDGVTDHWSYEPDLGRICITKRTQP